MVEFNNLRISVAAALIVVPVFLGAVEYSVEECQSKAAAGNAEAQWQLGQRYENGDGVKKNNMRALAQYKKAAEQKHQKACAKLADFYENGKFVKKDLVQAAKYKAWAEGDNGELAAAQARTSVEKSKEDEIETALDYILGRAGKSKDPKTGIRILYSQAKDKPIAQRVFVDRWTKGDLDDALDVLSGEEWALLIPWFHDAWNRGNKKTGLVLGNDAYRRKQYRQALDFWEKSGLPKCWYFIGRFYTTWVKEEDGGAPESWKNETLARKAYERCLRIDKTWDDARLNLGLIYIFADKKENINNAEALKIFSYFMKKKPDDKYFVYDYGYAGFWHANERLVKLEQEFKYSPSRQSYIRSEYNRVLAERDSYLKYIQRSASMGYDRAAQFLKWYRDNQSKNN